MQSRLLHALSLFTALVVILLLAAVAGSSQESARAQAPSLGPLEVGQRAKALAHGVAEHADARKRAGQRFRATLAEATDAGLRVSVRPDLRADSLRRIRGATTVLAQRIRNIAPPSPESVGVSSATLASIAACESGGNPAAVNAAGYYGKYQFSLSTWAGVGGSGNPAAAPEAEQDYRAALLYARSGPGQWPVCGR